MIEQARKDLLGHCETKRMNLQRKFGVAKRVNEAMQFSTADAHSRAGGDLCGKAAEVVNILDVYM